MAEAAVAQQAGTKIEVSRKELPLCCPNKTTDGANMHPRVFLPIEKSGEAVCPYCGAHYKLAD
ncbi:MAG: zinc-finger domain-containing protein [Candidatus Sedimenticola sp. 20ELBAFRAG]